MKYKPISKTKNTSPEELSNLCNKKSLPTKLF